MSQQGSEPVAPAQIDLAEVCQSLAEAPNINTAPRPALVERVLPWVEVFSKLATVALLLFAFLQYYESGRDKKRERALELVQEWVEGGQSEQMARVSAYVEIAARTAKAQVAALPSTTPKKVLNRAWENAQANTFGALVTQRDAETQAVRAAIVSLRRGPSLSDAGAGLVDRLYRALYGRCMTCWKFWT